MTDSNDVQKEIELLRRRVILQRREITELQNAASPATSAEALLDRMLARIEELCKERNRLRTEEPAQRRVLGGRHW